MLFLHWSMKRLTATQMQMKSIKPDTTAIATASIAIAIPNIAIDRMATIARTGDPFEFIGAKVQINFESCTLEPGKLHVTKCQGLLC